MATIQVLLVDDHPVVRDGLKMLINHQPDLNVCGEAQEAKTALKLAGQIQPDLVITDITLKESDGLELTKDIKACYPQIHVLVLSIHEESTYAERALRAGAQGYLMKEVASEKIIDAIHAVCRGDIYISPYMSTRLLHRMVGGKVSSLVSPVDSLSDRELEIFKLIGQGVKAAHIAQRLHLSVKTVETYRARIKEKLNFTDANELLQHAIRWANA